MPKIDTLIEFLESGDLAPRFYDMGRRIRPIAREDFIAFEHTEIPYPQPLQQQAWLALVLQTGSDVEPGDPQIWFLRFPLDEQAKLQLAARDDFMFQLMELLGKAAGSEEKKQREIEATLEQSPYTFQPTQERLAAFHARLTLDLELPPSRFYPHAREYFSGKLGWDQWSFIGYQGIADLAARHTQNDNEQCLCTAIPQLPPTPLEALCHNLENAAISPRLAETLLRRCRQTLQEEAPDPQVVTACLRGISFSRDQTQRTTLLNEVLQHRVARRSDVLAAIAGRLWSDLQDQALRTQFLEQLAHNDQGEAFFQELLADLLYIGDCRPGLLASLRTPDRSERLSQAIGDFFSAITPDN
jgi:hypothetical protein